MCEVTVLVVNRCYKKTEASGLGAICVYSAEHREAYLNKVGSLKLKVEFEGLLVSILCFDSWLCLALTASVSDEETSSFCSFASESTTSQTFWTERPPGSYSLKVQNLAQLIAEKYHTRGFLVNGYNWRLIIYPKGNEKDNGSGYISMYVEIDSTSEVFAYLTFFVYNKKVNKYLCIQDTQVKRFNALKKVWGSSQMLPLELFNDPKNGYIFEEDQCEFGVDVTIDSTLTNWEIVSFNENFCYSKFFFSVKNFTMLNEHLYYMSNTFSVGGKTWVLRFYRKCFSTLDDKWISIFLHLADNERLLPDERIYTRGHFRVLDPCGSNHITEKFNCWHDQSNSGCGHDKVVSMDKLREVYLDEDDTLSVAIEFEVISATSYSPINYSAII
ncbi:hypothetical protein Bca101_088870 [Brassica carinata]|uniref:MATH domain-containing protein n=1 Tax=Brassica oleracea TaxID=3712 RepID=A0A3P6FH81_BRAOL|nr:unnamed protein product [Brassica oleracea]